MNDEIETNAARVPVVAVKDGEVFASSRDIAAFFGKNHRDVTRAIDALIEQEPELGLRRFTQTPYVEPSTGQTYRSFQMDRDGFTLLAMGFQGTKALKWKLRYIEAFNAMEAEVRKRAASGPMIDMNDPTALRGLLLNYADKNIELQHKVDELEPSKEALHRIAEADGSLCITDAAKALQVAPKALFGYLRLHGWIYRRAGSAHDVGYQDRVNAGLLEHKVSTYVRPDGTERITEQARITPKGLTKLAHALNPKVPA